MKNNLNKTLKLFLKIADKLIHEEKIASYRQFSRKFLRKSANYIGALVYQNKSPSIISGFTLYQNLVSVNELQILRNELYSTIFEQIGEKIK